ncbi:DUF5681 domain-containing protein [Methylorubrum extorquens]
MGADHPHLEPEACRKRGFQKGQSGNPKGRPPVIREVKELARDKTELAVETLVQIMTNEKMNGSARVQAAVAILDRGWGRPKQSIDMKVDHEATGLAAAIRAMTEAKQQAVADQRPVIEIESVVEVVATASGKD